jgi:hypothetical protein
MAHFRRRVEDVVFCQAALLRACEPRGRTAEMIATGIHQAQRRLDTALRIAATIGGQKMPSDLDNPGVASVIHEARLEILATVASLS